MSDDDNDDKKVVRIPTRAKRTPTIVPYTVLRGGEPMACMHDRIFVDVDGTRTVTCRECGKTIDAFDALAKVAKREASFVHWMEHFKQEQKRLEADVERLKKLRASLRAGIKRRGVDPD